MITNQEDLVETTKWLTLNLIHLCYILEIAPGEKASQLVGLSTFPQDLKEPTLWDEYVQRPGSENLIPCLVDTFMDLLARDGLEDEEVLDMKQLDVYDEEVDAVLATLEAHESKAIGHWLGLSCRDGVWIFESSLAAES